MARPDGHRGGRRVLEYYENDFAIEYEDKGSAPKCEGHDEVEYYLSRVKELARWMDEWEQFERTGVYDEILMGSGGPILAQRGHSGPEWRPPTQQPTDYGFSIGGCATGLLGLLLCWLPLIGVFWCWSARSSALSAGRRMRKPTDRQAWLRQARCSAVSASPGSR